MSLKKAKRFLLLLGVDEGLTAEEALLFKKHADTMENEGSIENELHAREREYGPNSVLSFLIPLDFGSEIAQRTRNFTGR